VLRRFEMYSVAGGDRDPKVRRLAEAFSTCGQFIPEVLHSAVGWNLSPAPLQLVWEHAYASPEAYRRYMVHPFHAAVLDRYLLADSPERVVTDNDLGAGLVGYSCDGPTFVLACGVRRLVLLQVDRAASEAEVGRAAEVLESVPRATPAMALSVVGANTMGRAWFDGVTPMPGSARWSHVWEQGFESLDALRSYLVSDTDVASAERENFSNWRGGLVTGSVSVHYQMLVSDRPR